jgi:hypothetical protein
VKLLSAVLLSVMLASPVAAKSLNPARGWVEGSQGVESVVPANDGGFFDVLETAGVRTIERRDSAGKRLWTRVIDSGARGFFMDGATAVPTETGVVTISSRLLAGEPLQSSVLVVWHLRWDGSTAWRREFPNAFGFMPTVAVAADKIIVGIGGDKPRLAVMALSSGKSSDVILPKGTNPSYLVGMTDGTFGMVGLSKDPGKDTPLRSTFFTGNVANGIASTTVLPGKLSLAQGLVKRGDRFFILALIQSRLGFEQAEVEAWTLGGELEARHRLTGGNHVAVLSLSAGRHGMIAVTRRSNANSSRELLLSHILDFNGRELRRVELQCTDYVMVSKEQMIGKCYREDRSALVMLNPPN